MKSAFSLLVILAITSSPVRADIIYDVARFVGDATITGSITTDGTFGEINHTNVIGHSLMLTSPSVDGGTTSNSISAGTTFFLVATATDLFFDFDSTNPAKQYSLVNFQKSNGFLVNWVMEATTAAYFGAGTSVESVGFTDTSGILTTNHAGLVSIASKSSASVPAPNTLMLFALAIFLLARRYSARN